jgi:hypothetical protein
MRKAQEPQNVEKAVPQYWKRDGSAREVCRQTLHEGKEREERVDQQRSTDVEVVRRGKEKEWRSDRERTVGNNGRGGEGRRTGKRRTRKFR